MSESKKSDHFEPMRTASPEIQAIIREVLKQEQDNLHQAKPRLQSEIVEIIKRVIK